MLDSDLAMLYQVETKNLNRAAKRNEDRFPEDFRFQITREEYDNLKCQFGTSWNDLREFGSGGRRYMPYMYSEEGVAVVVYTKGNGRLTDVDAAAFNAQHGPLEVGKRTHSTTVS